MSPTLPPDEHLRALQRQAEQSVSPATLARLRRLRHGRDAARPQPRPTRWLPMAVTAGLALAAVGTYLQMPSPTPSTPAPMVAVMEGDDGGLDESGFSESALGESPDLYLWLGATDLAME